MNQALSPEDLANEWASLASHARMIEQDLAAPNKASPGPEDVNDYILPRIGAGFSEAIGLGRRPGAKLARSALKNRKMRENEDRDRKAQTAADRVIGNAQALRERTTPALAPRSAASLRRRLADARSAARPGTQVRRIAAAAEWVQATLTGSKGSAEEHGMALVSRIESRVRSLIQDVLGEEGPQSWTSRVPSDVRSNAERRWRANGERGHLLEYVDFPDLKKILGRRGNKPRFDSNLGNVDIILVKLTELAEIRNHLAHSRRLTKIERKKLEVYAEEFEQIARRGRSPKEA